jgi:hypothetical protein
MKKSSHNKIKNTIILFELLTRQVTSDTMKGVDASPALALLKKHFKTTSTLGKELIMYQTLVNESYRSEKKADMLINTVLGLRKKLKAESLKQEKYELIKEIKKHYDLTSFFNTKIQNYKLFASLYRLFEGVSVARAAELVDSRFTLLEHLTRTKQKASRDEMSGLLSEYKKQDEDVRLLAYQLMVDKFNSKYANLSPKQRAILKEYIYNVSNTEGLKEFMLKEAYSLKLDLQKQMKGVNDKVVKIKLAEAVILMKKYERIRNVKEENVLSLLLYHELLKELKNAERRTK